MQTASQTGLKVTADQLQVGLKLTADQLQVGFL